MATKLNGSLKWIGVTALLVGNALTVGISYERVRLATEHNTKAIEELKKSVKEHNNAWKDDLREVQGLIIDYIKEDSD